MKFLNLWKKAGIRILSALLVCLLMPAAFSSCGGEEPAKTGKTEEEQILYYEDKTAYVQTDEITDIVRLTVSFTDASGRARQGNIYLQLRPDVAPITVQNFQSLVASGFYDGLIFHRVYPGFMIQGGDPKGNGTGGSGTNIVGEFSSNGYQNDLKHLRGTISMARGNDNNSASSQFFIVQKDSASKSLDGKYAAFGTVLSGMEIVDGIMNVEKNPNGTKETGGVLTTPLYPVTILSAVFMEEPK